MILPVFVQFNGMTFFLFLSNLIGVSLSDLRSNMSKAERLDRAS